MYIYVTEILSYLFIVIQIDEIYYIILFTIYIFAK